MTNQKNKAHKQKHRSKSAVKKKQSGRGAARTIRMPQGSVRLQKGGLGQGDKSRRIQTSQQRRHQSRTNTVQSRRIGRGESRRIVSLIPMSETCHTLASLDRIRSWVQSQKGSTEDVPQNKSKSEALEWQGLQTSWLAVENRTTSPWDAIGFMAVSDIVVLVVSVAAEANCSNDPCMEEDFSENGEQESPMNTWYSDIGLAVDDLGRYNIHLLNAQGVPTVFIFFVGLNGLTKQRKASVVKLHERYFHSVLPSEKLFFHEEGELTKLWRGLKECPLFDLQWRQIKPYMLPDTVEILPDSADQVTMDLDKENASSERSQKMVHLRFAGHLRGQPISANQLLHVTGLGTYVIQCIEKDAIKFHRGELGNPDSLDCLNSVDPMLGGVEQTWPSAETFQAPIRYVQVPQGLSEYHTGWFEKDNIGVAPDSNSSLLTKKALKTSQLSFRDAEREFAGEIHSEEELTDREASGTELLSENNDEEEPTMDDANQDEVEFHPNMRIRERLAKYRGLTSFSAPWDSNENLPPSYAQIYHIRDYKRLVKDGVKPYFGDIPECDATCAKFSAGDYVSITVCAPESDANTICELNPLIISGLLPHEQKWTVLHASLQYRKDDFEEPIPSKHPMLCAIGFRLLYSSPLYSQLSSRMCDRAKYLRSFRESDMRARATFFGPLSHTPCPILAWALTQNDDGSTNWSFAANGTMLPPDPSLMLLKRITLTGRPNKVRNRIAAVRFMFFNAEDVQWFSPVGIRTKHGGKGSILKPIGSHGSFKALFKNPVQQHDVVCLDLWKRVFPKPSTQLFKHTKATLNV